MKKRDRRIKGGTWCGNEEEGYENQGRYMVGQGRRGIGESKEVHGGAMKKRDKRIKGGTWCGNEEEDRRIKGGTWWGNEEEG